MAPRSLQNRLKSTLERPKSIVSVICATKSASGQCPPPIFTNFDRFLDSLLEAILVKKSIKKSYLFSILFFPSLGDHFWWILGGFLELLRGQKSLRSRSRRDLLKIEKTFKNIVRYCKNQGFEGQKFMQKSSWRATWDQF